MCLPYAHMPEHAPLTASEEILHACLLVINHMWKLTASAACLDGQTSAQIVMWVHGMQVTPASTVVLAVPNCPMVKLDDKHYKLVDKLDALTEAVPSLINAKSIAVKGPVRFVEGTSIEGDVLISNGDPPSLPARLAAV